jgi:hypothetical protein
MSIFKKKVITCNAQFAHMEAPGLGACVFWYVECGKCKLNLHLVCNLLTSLKYINKQ